MEPLLAALPIAVILVLMLRAGWSAARSAIIGLGVALLLMVTVFGAPEGLGMIGLLAGVLAERAPRAARATPAVLLVTRKRDTRTGRPGSWLGTAIWAAMAFLVPFALLGLFAALLIAGR